MRAISCWYGFVEHQSAVDQHAARGQHDVVADSDSGVAEQKDAVIDRDVGTDSNIPPIDRSEIAVDPHAPLTEQPPSFQSQHFPSQAAHFFPTSLSLRVWQTTPAPCKPVCRN